MGGAWPSAGCHTGGVRPGLDEFRGCLFGHVMADVIHRAVPCSLVP